MRKLAISSVLAVLAALLILGLFGPLQTGSGAESWVKDDMGTPGGGGRRDRPALRPVLRGRRS
jgi:hypothetical protein